MKLNYEIQDNRLIITVNAKNQTKICGLDFNSTSVLYDVFENMIGNSELDWINPQDTGDLTDAPMLGILGEEGILQHTVFLENYGLVETGSDNYWKMVRPILNRWAFMDYQVRTPLQDLAEKGQVVFISEDTRL